MKKFFLFAILTAGVSFLTPEIYAADAPTESEESAVETNAEQSDDEATRREKAREEMRQRRLERRREMQERYQSEDTDNGEAAETESPQTRTQPFQVNAADGLTTERQNRMEQMADRRQQAFEAQALKEDSARSITYQINGEEITRFFEIQKVSDATYQIVETASPTEKQAAKEMEKTEREEAGKPAEVTEETAEAPESNVSMEWILSELGYTRVASVEVAEGEANETESAEPESSTTIIGPDGNNYKVADFVGSMRQQRSGENVVLETPEGVQIVEKSNWIKTADGTFTKTSPIRFGTNPMAGNQQGRFQNRQMGQGRMQGQNRQQGQSRTQNQRQRINQNQNTQRNQNRPRFGQGTPVRPGQDAAKDSDASGEEKTNQSRRQRWSNQNKKSDDDV